MTESTNDTKAKWAAPFFTIWTGQSLSLIGSRVGGFALTWWLTKETGSATVLAIASMLVMLPRVFLGPIAGALVDRWNRKRVMIVADFAVALLSLLLAVLLWTDSLQLWQVYAIMLLRAVGGTLHNPAMQASTPLMVPKEQLQRVAGMNQTLIGVLNIAAPPLGALLMEVMPLHGIMLLDVATAAFAIAPLFFVHIPQPERKAAAEGGPAATIWHDIRDGFRYVMAWRGLLMVVGMAILLNLLINPGMALLPILVQGHFDGGALQLGWLNSAWGIGLIVGGVALSAWGGFKNKLLTAVLAMIGQGTGFLIVGLTPAHALWMSIAGLGLSGASNPLLNGPLIAILQDVVAPELQGRVFTMVMSLAGLAAPLGLAIAGPLADRLGVQVWFLFGGSMCLVGAAYMWLMPPIRNIEADGQRMKEARAAAAE